jgi:hypothetical protein
MTDKTIVTINGGNRSSEQGSAFDEDAKQGERDFFFDSFLPASPVRNFA